MLFIDRHRKLTTEEQEQNLPPLQVSTHTVQGLSEEQIDFPPHALWSNEATGTIPQGQPPMPALYAPSSMEAAMPSAPSPMRMMGPLADSTLSPNVTHQLAELQTGNLPTITISPTTSKNTTTSLRAPMVIRSSMKRHHLQRRHLSKGGRIVLSMSAVCLCILLTVTALAAVTPVDHQGHPQGLGKVFQPLMNVVTSKNNNGSSISIQEAAATAATTDGYDPASVHMSADISSSSSSSSGSQPISSGASTLNRFFYGQCTYWANYRYHQLTGVWIPWLGNAYEWYGQAINYGWHTSSYPNPNGPSIMVLGPYVQQDLSAYGHVAVVEQINNNGTVTTSNMHWPYVGVVSYVTFTYPVSGEHFIWV